MLAPVYSGCQGLRAVGAACVARQLSVLLRSFSRLFRRGLAEAALHHVLWIGGNGTIAPQPAHHLRQDHTAELLPVKVHTPRVVHVITLLRQGLHQAHVLKEPIALLVVIAVAAKTAIVVPPV